MPTHRLCRLYQRKESHKKSDKNHTWRGIPHDIPKWQNVRYHYDIWSNPDENGVSVLDRVLRKLVEAEREKIARKAQTTILIVDSKSIQNADTAEEKGYDAGKKYLE